MYQYKNENPNGFDVEDCTIRALSTVLDIPWHKAYDMLSISARNLGLMMNSVEAVEIFLDERFDRVPIKESTVGQFIKNHPRGRFLIVMPGHITSLVDGINWDTFDSGKKPIWSAWFID